MKTENLIGKVIFFDHVQQTFDVNIETENGEKKGFIISSSTVEGLQLLTNFFRDIKLQDVVKLTILQGQVKNIGLIGEKYPLAWEFDLDDYPSIGVEIKESVYKKDVGSFKEAYLSSNTRVSNLHVVVAKASKNVYLLQGDREVHESRFRDFMQKCHKNDVLCFSIDPQGKIYNVCNRTQVFEFSC